MDKLLVSQLSALLKQVSSSDSYFSYLSPAVAHRLLVAGGLPVDGAQVNQLSPQEFEHRERVRHHSGVKISQELRDQLEQRKDRKPNYAVRHILTHPQQDLVVAPMGDTVGKGLFYVGKEPIKKGSLVMLYEGTLLPGNRSMPPAEVLYRYDLPRDDCMRLPALKSAMAEFDEDESFAYFAGRYGGLSRFLQCGITAIQRDALKGVEASDRKHIPVTNLAPVAFEHMGCLVIGFVACRDIVQNEHLSFRYAQDTNMGFEKILFDRYGRTIGEVDRNNRATIYKPDALRKLPVLPAHNEELGREYLQALNSSREKCPISNAWNFKMNILLCIKQYEVEALVQRGDTALFSVVKTLLKTAESLDEANAGQVEKFKEELSKILLQHTYFPANDKAAQSFRNEAFLHLSEYGRVKKALDEEHVGPGDTAGATRRKRPG